MDHSHATLLGLIHKYVSLVISEELNSASFILSLFVLNLGLFDLVQWENQCRLGMDSK